MAYRSRTRNSVLRIGAPNPIENAQTPTNLGRPFICRPSHQCGASLFVCLSGGALRPSVHENIRSSLRLSQLDPERPDFGKSFAAAARRK